MAIDLLGPQIDIHSGGIDHIPVHHENEIAQSEAAMGKHPFVQFWVHHNFLRVEGEKMSKSLENFFTVEDIKSKKIDPMALRLLFLQTHYRQELNFTWESVRAAQEALTKLRALIATLRESTESNGEETNNGLSDYRNEFIEKVSDDLQIPQAVALMWKMLKDRSIPDSGKLTLLLEFDRVFGLDIESEKTKDEIPKEITKLAEKRKKAKEKKDYATADALREQIQTNGYSIEDKPKSYILKKLK
jgi:cysteinyl-tRNA synthetase